MFGKNGGQREVEEDIGRELGMGKMTKDVEALLLEYYSLSRKIANGGLHDDGHDDSGGHPDYHCDQHDNSPWARRDYALQSAS